MAKRTPEEQLILDNIIACMLHKGLDQKDMFEHIGGNPQKFTNWKNGNNSSYMKMLPQIAEYLDVPLDTLMGKVVISETSILEDRLLKYFSLCDADGKLRIIQFAMNEFDRTQKEKTEDASTTPITEDYRIG